MRKVSYMLAKDLVKIHEKLTFDNNILLEFEQINQPSMTLIMPTLFETKKVLKPLTTAKARDENLESDRTSLMSEKIQTKQSLLFPKVPSNHQIGTQLSNQQTSKLNEYINKLTLPYFNSFCQPFHTKFYSNLFDQRLLCCYEKLFQPVHKNVIKNQDMIANLPLT